MPFIFNLNYKITLNLRKQLITTKVFIHFFYAPKCPQIKMNISIVYNLIFWLHLHCYFKTVQIYS